jgi:hypothetical protein
VQTVTTFVPRDPLACWRLFTDVALLGAWVPGLRRAQVLAKERGLPLEVHFEFAESRAYTLLYSYDPERHEVRWQPKLGRRDAVTGFARFDAAEGGTRLTYGLEHGEGRTPAERELGDLHRLVESLTAWLVAHRA